MAEINSPLGKQTVASSAGEMRTFSVPDATQAPPEEQEFRNADDVLNLRRRMMQEAAQVNNTSERTRVEFLAGMGRAVKLVEIVTPEGKVTYHVRTLKSKEMKFLFQQTEAAAKTSQVGSVFDGRILSLALAVFAIDGIDFDVILGCQNSPDRLHRRIDFFDELDDVIVNKIYEEWGALVKEHNSKYAIKDEKDAKEVMASVKKSG